MDKLKKYHGIRDPVHGWISYTDAERDLIDSPLVQRLRWVNQLTGAHEVYPGGTNTRFNHSLGVMFLAGKYWEAIVANSPQLPLPKSSEYYLQCVRIAALLHDIGHGPFSHAFDETVYQNIYPSILLSEFGRKTDGHDQHREKIVRSPELKNYINACGIDPEDLILIWTPNKIHWIYDILRLIVQGPLGADRMDFTLRDSHFTGMNHFGFIDAERIQRNSSIRRIEDKWYLHYHVKCLSDIINALDGRLNMYESVYYHKTVYATDILIHEMMRLATQPLGLVERTLDLEKFSILTDSILLGEILSSTSTELEPARTMALRLVRRQLPKMIKEVRILTSENFNLKDYQSDNINNIIIKTKPLEGLDPLKFESYGIYFDSGKHSGKSLTCREALNTHRYHPSQEPFFFVRIYQL